MKKLAIISAVLMTSTSAFAQSAERPPYSFTELGKIIEVLCQEAMFGFRADVETTCPAILKRLESQIAAEKAEADKKAKDKDAKQ